MKFKKLITLASLVGLIVFLATTVVARRILLQIPLHALPLY